MLHNRTQTLNLKELEPLPSTKDLYVLLAECVPVTGISIMYLSSFFESQDLQNHLIETVSIAVKLQARCSNLVLLLVTSF